MTTAVTVGLVVALLAVPAPAAAVPTARPGGSVAGPAEAPPAARPVGPAVARVPPVPGRPVRPYVAPPHEYGPGHRGVDLPAVAGAPIGSPAAGTVTFAGPVAGRGVLVVEHAGGTLTSLEPVTAAAPVGTRVRAGEPVATLAASPPHAGCPTGCLHWGVRVGGRYVDPWWWLGRTRQVRLLPFSGAPPHLAGSPSHPTGPPGRADGRVSVR